MVDPFRALADPTRRAILDLLGPTRELPAGEIAAAFPVSRPAISKHLSLLRRAGLVAQRRHGREKLYRRTEWGLAPVRAWLAGVAPGAGPPRSGRAPSGPRPATPGDGGRRSPAWRVW